MAICYEWPARRGRPGAGDSCTLLELLANARTFAYVKTANNFFPSSICHTLLTCCGLGKWISNYALLITLSQIKWNVHFTVENVHFERLKTKWYQMDDKWCDWLETFVTIRWNMSHQPCTLMWLINHCWVKWTTTASKQRTGENVA